MANIESRTDGYSRLSIYAHWLTAIIVVALFVTHEGRRGDLMYTIHASGGAIVGLFLLWRVWHRIRRGMTSEPHQHFMLNWLSRLVFFGLLLALIVVVLTGYLLPWSLGRPVDIFGWFAIPSPMGANRSIHEAAEWLHDFSGTAFPPLVLLHLIGVLKHALIDRDSIARRMFISVIAGK